MFYSNYQEILNYLEFIRKTGNYHSLKEADFFCDGKEAFALRHSHIYRLYRELRSPSKSRWQSFKARSAPSSCSDKNLIHLEFQPCEAKKRLPRKKRGYSRQYPPSLLISFSILQDKSIFPRSDKKSAVPVKIARLFLFLYPPSPYMPTVILCLLSRSKLPVRQPSGACRGSPSPPISIPYPPLQVSAVRRQKKGAEASFDFGARAC